MLLRGRNIIKAREDKIVCSLNIRDIYYAKYYSKGGNGQPGKKNKNHERNEKGERKKKENCIKNGEKGLKNASFWAINLFVGEKN